MQLNEMADPDESRDEAGLCHMNIFCFVFVGLLYITMRIRYDTIRYDRRV